MKLVLKTPSQNKLDITKNISPCFDSSWHYHEHYELLYITRSYGMRFVGDSISTFHPGDLVLVGPRLPHLWRNDSSYYKPNEVEKIKTVVIKFSSDFLGPEIFNLPEFDAIKTMLNKSARGVSFAPNVSKLIHNDLVSIVDYTPTGQMVKMLEILNHLSTTENMNVLSSTNMQQYTSESHYRIDAVFKYIAENHSEDIMLQDVAEVACMTPNSFCRFLKRMTNKSYVGLLNEIRIKNATRLLLQAELPIADAGSLVGYNSVTNFNKQFKNIMGCTPRTYRNKL